jgi:hypothetical protein
MKVERPAQGAQPHLATIKPRPRPVFMVMTTPWVFDPRSETHGVDLIKDASARRAVPDPGRTPVAAPAGSAVEFTPFASTPHPSRWPAWQN